MSTGNAELKRRFTYHPPTPDQIRRYEELRQCGLDWAFKVEYECPDSREKSLALTAIEQSVMWANAAIARRE